MQHGKAGKIWEILDLSLLSNYQTMNPDFEEEQPMQALHFLLSSYMFISHTQEARLGFIFLKSDTHVRRRGMALVRILQCKLMQVTNILFKQFWELLLNRRICMDKGLLVLTLAVDLIHLNICNTCVKLSHLGFGG